MKKVIIIFFLLIPVFVFGQKRIYVSTSGNDSNTGLDTTHAVLTLLHAQSIASAGDTICLRAGDEFHLTSTFHFSKSGTSNSARIVWDGMLWGPGGDTAVIANYGTGIWTMRLYDVRYITIQNIIVDGRYLENGDGFFIGGNREQDDEHDITIQNCDIKRLGRKDQDDYSPGIFIRPTDTDIYNIEILNNHIHDIGRHGISLYPSRTGQVDVSGPAAGQNRDILIAYNTIENYGGTYGLGIHIDNRNENIIVEHNIVDNTVSGSNTIIVENNESASGYYATNCIIRYNHVINDHLDGILFADGGAVTAMVYGNIVETTGNDIAGIGINGGVDWTGAYIEIYNNTIISRSGAHAIRVLGAPKLSLRNNILWIEGSNSFCVWYNGSDFTHTNNNYYSTTIGNPTLLNLDLGGYITRDGVSSFEPTAITKNPLFAEISSNWHLQAGSPAIYGIPIEGISEDIEGLPMADPPFMGCYQSYAGDNPPNYASSEVKNSTPDVVDIAFDLYLDNNSEPDPDAFEIFVNSVSRNISLVEVINNMVRLTFEGNPVEFEDVISVSYIQPGTNAIQSQTGLPADSFTNEPVTNNVADPNPPDLPPILVINYDSTSYAGFVHEIDASGSYDGNNDPLSFEWTAPDSVPVSSINTSKIQFLAPMVDKTEEVDFFLSVSDGNSVQTKTISINIIPYKPELTIAKVINIEASDYEDPNYPENIIDDNIETRWSALGINQWLIFELEKPFKVSHLELSFLLGQQRESYFDIYAGKDSLFDWQPILFDAASCDFSGNTQVFDFPEAESQVEYSYLKLVGQGNSQDTWNSFSEIKILGHPRFDEFNIFIYPNPAHDYIDVSIEDPGNTPDDPVFASRDIRILDVTGVVFFEGSVIFGTNMMRIPINLHPGTYIVQLVSGSEIMIAKVLIVI